ncbi:MAG: hypothetical protein AUG49_13245 [Catenulispora sp. 13_1_20CM_3_70_7]|nr:MAG: hypothetical protein AUG49_13245 [Catenulispora sp. 13_1_20CM_3_70_7]
MATSLEDAAPTEAVSPVAALIRSRRSPAISRARAAPARGPVPCAEENKCAMSRNASSRLSGSTSGDSSCIRAMTVSL